MSAVEFFFNGSGLYFAMKLQQSIGYVFLVFLAGQLSHGQLFGVVHDVGSSKNMQWMVKATVPQCFEVGQQFKASLLWRKLTIVNDLVAFNVIDRLMVGNYIGIADDHLVAGGNIYIRLNGI